MCHYDELSSNPCAGLTIVRTKAEKQNARLDWTIEELNQIFRSPPYTGARSARYFMTKGDMTLDDSLIYWAPLISLFSGMRNNEICQLELRDISENKATHIWTMQVEDRVNSTGVSNSAKSDNAERRIPIHHTLIELGFLDFVSRMKAKGEVRLFPEAKPDKQGYLSGRLTGQFKRLTTELGIYHPKKGFTVYAIVYRQPDGTYFLIKKS